MFANAHTAQLAAIPIWLFREAQSATHPSRTPIRPTSVRSWICSTPKEHRRFAGRLDHRQLGFAERAVVSDQGTRR
jgi:hypothetical protein